MLAANYLQTLDWHGDANLMRIIVQMYTKAGDTTSLASFYEACAQIEIDEFRDYEKVRCNFSDFVGKLTYVQYVVKFKLTNEP